MNLTVCTYACEKSPLVMTHETPKFNVSEVVPSKLKKSISTLNANSAP